MATLRDCVYMYLTYRIDTDFVAKRTLSQLRNRFKRVTPVPVSFGIDAPSVGVSATAWQARRDKCPYIRVYNALGERWPSVW